MRLAQLARATGIHLDRRDAAPVGRRHHGSHQGEHSVAHRVCGQFAGRFARHPRHERRRAAARPRRHALSSDRRAQTDPRAGRAHDRRPRFIGSSISGRGRRAPRTCSTSRSSRSATTTSARARTSIRFATTRRSFIIETQLRVDRAVAVAVLDRSPTRRAHDEATRRVQESSGRTRERSRARS